jgi:hypothetical protein
MSECQYKKGGSKKYILTKTFVVHTKVKPKHTIFTSYCGFLTRGVLVIYKGYEWDGPSGPAIDSDNFMDGSLVHDLLYELLRDGHLKPRWKYRLWADNEMFRQCKKDDMFIGRRIYTWLGVRVGGFWSAR